MLMISPRRLVRTASWTLLALAALAGPLRAGDLTVVELLPSAATAGTRLHLRLDGLLGKGRPRIWLTRSDDGSPSPRRVRVKVKSITELGGFGTRHALDLVVGRVRSGPGAYDLHIRPRGKGAWPSSRTTTSPSPASCRTCRASTT